MNRLGICTCIALYDLNLEYIQQSNHIRDLFYYLVKWFNENALPPTRMSLAGQNIPRSTKTRTFNHCRKLLEKNAFQLIEYFWVGSSKPDDSSDYFDSFLSFGIDLKEKNTFFTLYFHNDVISHDWLYVEKLIKELAQWVKSGYGIAYQRDFNKGPGMYPYGVIVGLDDKDDPLIKQERSNLTKWFHTYGDPEDYHHGDLRDIYPLNLLSKEHLERSINGKTLQSWIESSSDHGTLKPLTDTLWSWRVPEDKISIVREVLRPSGIILCI